MAAQAQADGGRADSSLSNSLVSVGDVLAGKYEVERVLGAGGMGVVVSAMHRTLQERVALKFLLPHVIDNQEFVRRFLREAQICAKLKSEHITRVTDVGTLDTGAPYMVMEYLEGMDLRKLLRQSGPLEVPRAIDYIVQACEGLAEAHSRGIVHRDLKPSNLFLVRDRDGTDLIKVLDFGVSKAGTAKGDDAEDLTSAGMMLGSPRYMSPEQLTNSGGVDARADVWSLAVILYQLLTGDVPYKGDSQAETVSRILGNGSPTPITDYRSDVSPEVEAAILCGITRELDERTPNVTAFAEHLLLAAEEYVSPSMRMNLTRMRAMVPQPISESLLDHSLSESGSYSSVVRSSPKSETTMARSTVVSAARAEPDSSRGKILALVAAVILLGGVGAWLLFIVLSREPHAPPGAAGQLPPVAESTRSTEPEVPAPAPSATAQESAEAVADEPPPHTAPSASASADEPATTSARPAAPRPAAPRPPPPRPTAKPDPVEPKPAPTANPLEDRF